MLLWSALGVPAFARGLALENCGCFGALWRQELRWWVPLEDAYLLGLSVWLVWRATPRGLVRAVEGDHDGAVRDRVGAHQLP